MSTLVKPSNVPKNSLIIDVRSADEFAYGHIIGSQNIPLEELALHVMELRGKNEPVYLSCKSGRRAEVARQQLKQAGIEDVYCIAGGFNSWKKDKLPIHSYKSGISIMRQVHIIVGAMVLTGFLFSPLWVLTPIAGVGMLFSGVTNTCMMAAILSKMPWNKND